MSEIGHSSYAGAATEAMRLRGTALRLGLACLLLVWPVSSHAADGRQFRGIPSERPQADQPLPFAFRPVPDRARPAQRFDANRLALWTNAALGHRPGRHDAAVDRVAAWSATDLAGVLVDLGDVGAALAKLVKRRTPASLVTDQAASLRLAVRDWEGQAADAIALLGLTPEEVWASGITDLVTRGVVLHTDVGVLAAEAVSATDSGHTLPLMSIHCGVALALVDGLARTSPDRRFVLDWYRGALGFLQLSREIEAAPLLVERALALFPDDVYLLMSAGCIHELLASPVVQDREVLRDAGLSPAVESAASHLRKAERAFREAIRREPARTEAGVRLGHILGRLGRHADSLAVLRRAQPPSGDPFVAYFAWLFLGDEEAMAGHGDAARQAYARALELAPKAQSCWLSISRLARRSGDRAGSVTAMRRTLESGSDADREDPWSRYDQGAGRQADELIRRL